MAFLWRADDGPALNAGLVALRFFRGSGPVLLRYPIFSDLSGGGVRTPCPSSSGSAHELSFRKCSQSLGIFLRLAFNSFLAGGADILNLCK